MGLISIIGRGLRALFGTPRSFTVGEKFEHYARRYLFTPGHYDLIQKTHGYRKVKTNYVPSADPDFKFRDRRKGKIFYVEVKYRASFYKGQLSWCTDNQLNRYQQRNNEIPVFILLGVGGRPDRPAFISLIPLHRANFTTLYKGLAEKYSVSTRKKISPRLLWKR